jgi:hypothetical protein
MRHRTNSDLCRFRRRMIRTVIVATVVLLLFVSTDRAQTVLDCTGRPYGTPCDDGDVCTVGDACDGLGGCKATGRLNCDDGNPCTRDDCDPATG